MRYNSFYTKFMKRILDLIFSIVLICLISPVLLLIYIAILIFDGTPVIFKQQRVGIHEKIFTIYKFRTMNPPISGKLSTDKERLSLTGSFLRRSSLDEIPELFNIVKGDMSFVGPRPLLTKYIDRYNDYQRQRHLVNPGLTGLVQISGRNSLDWPAKFKLDVDYVNNISFVYDIKIVFKTMLEVLKQDGISSSEEKFMEEFKGNSVDE